MAEGLVIDLIKQLVSIAAQEAAQEVKLVVGVDEEVEKLKDNLQTVKAVLNDAEKRQVKDDAVKLWLGKLNNACYEMEDVVDEWNTAMVKLAIQKEEKNAYNAPVLKKKVCSFIPSPSCCLGQVDKLVLRHDISHKIKELNGKLDEIVRERGIYGFELTRVPTLQIVERPKTTCLVDVSEICGRDKVRDKLVSILLGKESEEERSPHIISLVGMGGIGKTTLAQLVYNDPEVQSHFKKNIMWVCVSEPFDQFKVAKAIIEALGGGHLNDIELQSLLGKICEIIRREKFFLVLDDVWTENSTLWEPFRLAFKFGAQGSRILVTTRKSRVAEMMGKEGIINLEVLSEEDCWLVFSKIAFVDRDPKQCEQLENLGKQIVKKCKGLPLAAKTLGSLMRFKSSRGEWKSVLDSNMWELEDVERSLFAPLLLSYYDLSSPLKQCFTYCSMFPKDYVFSSEELVFMWMAQGYIKSKASMEIEIMARECFENLAIRSFFQDFKKDKDDDKIINCKMHDIVHDFAQLMSKNECFTINGDIELGLNYKNARHLQLEIGKEAQFPKSVYSAQNLRTLIFVYQTYNNLSNLFQHFRRLRTLTLNIQYNVFEELPDAVENFIHLRYLNLVNYRGEGLPETICNLCNLQILKIKIDRTWSMKLPQGIGKLINLRHLILNGFYLGVNLEFPRGFERLTSLRTLSHFAISVKDDGKGCKLGELKNLNHLQGTLRIRGLGNVIDVCEAENAQLKKKIGLRTLELQFSGSRRENNVLVLNALEPPPDLEYLRIENYSATIMSPNWMMSLTNLKKLDIRHIRLERLPSLGKLPCLESLSIVVAHYLKMVDVEFLGIEFEKKKKDDIIIIVFPNLKSLQFYYLDEWEEWIGIGGEEEDYIITIMPCLQELTILSCPKLKTLPNFLPRTPLQKLDIRYSSILSGRCNRETGEEWPKISHIPNINIGYDYVQRDGREVN